jgi:hypothetical protein
MYSAALDIQSIASSALNAFEAVFPVRLVILGQINELTGD